MLTVTKAAILTASVLAGASATLAFYAMAPMLGAAAARVRKRVAEVIGAAAPRRYIIEDGGYEDVD